MPFLDVVAMVGRLLTILRDSNFNLAPVSWGKGLLLGLGRKGLLGAWDSCFGASVSPGAPLVN